MVETFTVHLLYPKSIPSGTATARKVPCVCLHEHDSELWCGHYPAWLGLHLVFVPRLCLWTSEPLQSRQELLLCPRRVTLVCQNSSWAD